VGRSDLVVTLARLADVQMLAVAKTQGSSSMAHLFAPRSFKIPISFEIPILKESWQVFQNNIAEAQRSERGCQDNERESPSAPPCLS
jgi:hypothetical protein